MLLFPSDEVKSRLLRCCTILGIERLCWALVVGYQSCNQPALSFIRLLLAIRMRNVPFVGKKAGGETQSELSPFTNTFPIFFKMILHLFTMIFQYFFSDALNAKHWSARLQCDHLLWACLPSPLFGSLRVPGRFRSSWTPRLHYLRSLQRVPVFSCQLVPVGRLGSAEIAPCSVMKSPSCDFCNPDAK